MEIAGLLLGITGPAQRLVDVAKSIKARCDAIRGNRGAADTLVQMYELMARQLSNFQSRDRDTLEKFSPHHRANLQAELESLCTFAQQNEKKLRHKLDRLRSPRYAATHAMRNIVRFTELERDAARVQESIGRINGIMALAEKIDTVAAACSSSGQPDVFRACNTAPRNPTPICIDFESKDATGQPATMEGQLKAVLLQSKTASSFGAIAQGMGGVGKTCALRALAADKEVNERFPGGVYFMSLGADATTKQLIDELADSVACSGGKKAAAEMREDWSLARTIRRAHEWFAGQCCLFMFDDVWCSNDIKEDVLVRLSVLMSHCGEDSPSRLVYSTRDEGLSLQGEKVAFKPREALGKEAMTILLRAAGAEAEEAENTSCRSAIRGILQRCSGLPVTLNLCGTSVKRMRSTWPGNREDAWCEYRLRLESKTLLTRSADSYGPLGAALLVSLEFLDKVSIKKGRHPRLSYQEMHRALSLLRKQDWVPVEVLQRLWNLIDRSLTENIVMEMAGVGVLYDEHRTLDDGRPVLGIRLHDLVHDFSQEEAKRHEEETKWPVALLDAYGHGHGHGSEEEAPLWVIDLNSDEDGGYMVRNMCRLLIRARRFVALEKLLRSGRWSVKMLEIRKILQLEQDVQMYLDNRPGGPSAAKRQKTGNEETRFREGETGRERWMRALCKIVRQSLGYCAGNAHGAWFQLYARLMATSGKPKWMEEMMAEADACAPRPWLKALGPCLEGADSALTDTYFKEHDVRHVEFVKDKIFSLQWAWKLGTFFVGKHGSGGESELVQLKISLETGGGRDCVKRSESPPPPPVQGELSSAIFFKNGQQVATGWTSGALRVFDTNTGDLRWEVAEGRGCEVRCVAVAQDGSRVASGSEDGMVRIWDGESGLQTCEILAVHSDRVRSVALSRDGRRVMAVPPEGAVRVWAIETGEETGSTRVELVNTASHPPVMVFGARCCGFVCNEDRPRIVCEIEEEKLQVWDVETGQKVGPAFAGHWEDSVHAMSADGRRVALYIQICGTVRVWDVETGTQVGPELTGGQLGEHCAAVSADGRRVALALSSGPVRVWDVESRHLTEAAVAGEEDHVLSIAVSADGRRVVSGSGDGTVRMWDVESGEQVAVGAGHDHPVIDIATSANGWRVVSCARGEVRVWDGDTGEQVGPPALAGHRDWIGCVDVSADGRRVVSGWMFAMVRVWDAETGQQIGPALTGHMGLVSCVAISASGQTVASASRDRTMRVWDVETGHLVATFKVHSHAPPQVAVSVSGDGRRVLSCSGYNPKFAGNAWVVPIVELWDVESATRVREYRKLGKLCLHSLDWKFLRQEFWERPIDPRFELPKYRVRGRDIVFRGGGSDKVVATLEVGVIDMLVIAQPRTLVVLSSYGGLTFLRIAE